MAKVTVELEDIENDEVSVKFTYQPKINQPINENNLTPAQNMGFIFKAIAIEMEKQHEQTRRN